MLMRRRRPQFNNYRPRSRGAGKARLLIALAIAGFSLFSYFKSGSYNPVTGEKQYVSIAPHQEIALGLQAAPRMIQQHGGLYPDQNLQNTLDRLGNELLVKSDLGKLPWKFDFHLLRDPQTVNAFALPGGQVFITAALYGRLKSQGQLAGVIGHEIGHVLARHSAQQMAKSQLMQGLVGAVVAGSGQQSAQMAQMVGQMINMKYGREDELESDHIGVGLMVKAGYDPRGMIEVMKVLAAASGGARQPEFSSTHPSPENRIQKIEDAIREHFPNGVPSGLRQ